MVLTVKQVVLSKVNWAALILLVLGFVTDPTFTNILPPNWAPFILKVSGPVLFIIKTFFTKQVPIEQPLVMG